MADPKFFTKAGPFSVAQLAKVSGAVVSGSADSAAVYNDVAPLDAAESHHVSFLDNTQYTDAFRASRAGVCIIRPEYADAAPAGMALLVTSDPYRAYAKTATAFYPLPVASGDISAAAQIDETAELGEGAEIAAGAVIAAHAIVGARCRIGENAVIGPGVILGDDSSVGPCASLAYSEVGKRVLIYPGARIGQDGFGFAPGAEGHLKVPQLGRVIIGDDVEIGANSTIDRGSGPDTIIGDGARIDNLVQIGHNVQIGRGCILVSQVGVSGSTEIGDFAVLAGQVGVAGHLKIGAGAKIAAQGGAIQDVPPGVEVGGTPTVPVRQWLRTAAYLNKLMKKKGK
jgi:UDP-3-O-[3-hydroxymyristoyl] glucosamine N-acyltransferase